MKKKIFLAAMLSILVTFTGLAGDKKDNNPEHRTMAFEVGYLAGSFDCIKASSAYGIGWHYVPWTLAKNVNIGFHVSPLNFNYGFVPSEYATDTIMIGPAIGCFFGKGLRIIAPLDVMCSIAFDNNDKARTAWGLSLSPAIYIGRKYGLYVGPMASIAFADGADPAIGFKAGFFF